MTRPIYSNNFITGSGLFVSDRHAIDVSTEDPVVWIIRDMIFYSADIDGYIDVRDRATGALLHRAFLPFDFEKPQLEEHWTGHHVIEAFSEPPFGFQLVPGPAIFTHGWDVSVSGYVLTKP